MLAVCQLTQDLEQLPFGLDTQIGEKGVNISGGQRARISLARACYADCDIYLLDDPLSAVDSHVARNLFFNCIRGFLREKTVILATHQFSFLPHSDKVVQLEAGSIKFNLKVEDCNQFMNFRYESEKITDNTKVVIDS